jgi:hypothetical protein
LIHAEAHLLRKPHEVLILRDCLAKSRYKPCSILALLWLWRWLGNVNLMYFPDDLLDGVCRSWWHVMHYDLLLLLLPHLSPEFLNLCHDLQIGGRGCW